jgi:hypothetical protein
MTALHLRLPHRWGRMHSSCGLGRCCTRAAVVDGAWLCKHLCMAASLLQGAPLRTLSNVSAFAKLQWLYDRCTRWQGEVQWKLKPRLSSCLVRLTCLEWCSSPTCHSLLQDPRRRALHDPMLKVETVSESFRRRLSKDACPIECPSHASANLISCICCSHAGMFRDQMLLCATATAASAVY